MTAGVGLAVREVVGRYEILGQIGWASERLEVEADGHVSALIPGRYSLNGYCEPA